MNKKRETIRKPTDHEAIPDWDEQDRLSSPKQAQKGKQHIEEDAMIREKGDE